MDKIELSDRTLRILSSSAERFIGYLYGGLLPLAILAIENSTFVEQLVRATGGILIALICFVLGIGIFTLYFRVVGELFIYPFQHLIHYIIDKIYTGSPEESSSTIRYLWHLGVPLIRCRGAYQTLKDDFFKGQEQKEVQISHGELHVIYLTSVITIFAYFIIQLTKGQASKVYLLISIISLLAALVADTRQHSREAFRLRSEQEGVIKFLSEKGFIERVKS